MRFKGKDVGRLYLDVTFVSNCPVDMSVRSMVSGAVLLQPYDAHGGAMGGYPMTGYPSAPVPTFAPSPPPPSSMPYGGAYAPTAPAYSPTAPVYAPPTHGVP